MAKVVKKNPEPIVEEIKDELKEDLEEVKEEVQEDITTVKEVEKEEVKEIKSKFKFSKKKGFIVGVAIIAVFIVALFAYSRYLALQNPVQNNQTQTANQNQDLINKVGQLIVLPTDEKPRIATVTDITQLAGQSFFTHALNGDKVLIYTQAGIAILYRQSINKLINVAPVNTTTQPGPQAINPSKAPQPQNASVTVLNGTLTVGLAKAASSKIQTNLSNITVSATGDSANGNYQSTIVIDVSGNRSQAASQIANLLGGQVQSSIPSGEVKPTSDILVILGSNYSK